MLYKRCARSDRWRVGQAFRIFFHALMNPAGLPLAIVVVVALVDSCGALQTISSRNFRHLHSGSNKANVKIEHISDGLAITISDHGRGIPNGVLDRSDHVSILKFIERNWDLQALTGRSRDNFPNPVVDGDNPYVPLNSPALGDLFDFFHFDGAEN